MPTTSKKPAKRERKLKTVKPVIVLDIDELDRLMNSLVMLINKEQESAQTRVNINHNAKLMLSELRKSRRTMTEYYRLTD